MSRIYDALKIAEKQGVAQVPVIWTEVPAVAEPAAPSKTVAEPCKQELEHRAQPIVAAPLHVQPAPAEQLLGCRQENWHPSSQLLDFNRSEFQPGTEEFRTLRSRLQQIRTRRPVQILLVTSATQGEGKSFVAANLASVLASQSNQKVVLIDADLRRSTLHQSLGAPTRPGLSEFLCGEAEQTEIIQRGADPKLYFVSAGETRQNATDLLGNGRMGVLLRQLQPLFDWIIIDSPPALPISDAVLLAAACDGVLLVVRSGETQIEDARRASEEFDRDAVLGVVVNRVPMRTLPHGYYGYTPIDLKKARAAATTTAPANGPGKRK
jgi:protein-tyrosine kinase